MWRKWQGLVGGLLVAGVSASSGAASEDGNVNTIYDFYLGGIKAGELTIDADFDGAIYRAESVLRTAGVVGMVYKASFEAEAEGRLTSGGLEPARFAADSRMRSKAQSVEMIYSNRAPGEVRAEPAFSPRPWQIDPAEQTGTLDPITAALTALAPTQAAAVCNSSVEVFDGRRRYAIDLGKPTMDGDRIRCPALYRRIAGFKPKMMKKRPKFPFHVWFEERADGKAHMVRAAGDSMFGIAVILLRD
ncbi:MAG: DUF3108 domain-containing protein [Pseudomonadota bacterium]